MQPLKRTEFRDAITRLERAPRRAASGESKLGKIYTFVGTKGGVGTTSMAVNFAAVLAQRKQNTVILDLDWIANDVAMQLGASPQYTLLEVGENLARMDQALFEGFVTRDPLGFFLVGPPDALEQRGYFTEHMFREFATFLVEKYDAIVIDGGRAISDEVVLGGLPGLQLGFSGDQSGTSLHSQRPALYRLPDAHGLQPGSDQDCGEPLSRKRSGPNHASLEQIQQTLNQPVFYGIPHSPACWPRSIRRGRWSPTGRPPGTRTRRSGPSWTRRIGREAASGKGESRVSQ